MNDSSPNEAPTIKIRKGIPNSPGYLRRVAWIGEVRRGFEGKTGMGEERAIEVGAGRVLSYHFSKKWLV